MKQVEGILLAVGEVLEVAGDAGVEHVAPAVDDAGIREHEGDQADMLEVKRMLVDDALRFRRQLAQAAEVGVGEAADRLGPEGGDARRVGSAAAVFEQWCLYAPGDNARKTPPLTICYITTK